MNGVLIPVSCGEFVDRITILAIKAERLASEEARANVRRELCALLAMASAFVWFGEISALKDSLQKTNEDLWEMERRIRRCDSIGSFGAEFVTLARGIYRLNDMRAAIKREIDMLAQSEIREEKDYL